MGNCSIQNNNEEEEPTNLSSKNFEFIQQLGSGNFAKVWKVQRKKTSQFFAMKIMSKERIIKKGCVQQVINEKNLLSTLKHPFIVNLIAAFQDRKNLYLKLDLLTGGDFRQHLLKQKQFSEEQSKFFIASIIVGLEYLHEQGVIHRDLKPENLLLDNTGYIRISDFGLSSLWKPENSQETNGTFGYMAPEIMCKANHGVAVDFFALGIIAYECMMGKRPYNGRNSIEIRDSVFSRQVQIKRAQLPIGWSLEAGDFVNQLIQRKPENRLGYKDPSDVKNHPWFQNFNWKQLKEKKMISPFCPKKNASYSNYDAKTQSGSNENKNNQSIDNNQFKDYYFEARSFN